MVAITAIRIFILASRSIDIASGSDDLQERINRLHMGYFIFIALVEMWSAFFLYKALAYQIPMDILVLPT